MARVPRHPGKGAEAFLYGASPMMCGTVLRTVFPTPSISAAFAPDLRQPEQPFLAVFPIAGLRCHERNRLKAIPTVNLAAGALSRTTTGANTVHSVDGQAHA